MTVFSHQVMLINLVHRLVSIGYFYINSESEEIYGCFFGAIEHLPGYLLTANSSWMLGHEFCKTSRCLVLSGVIVGHDMKPGE